MQLFPTKDATVIPGSLVLTDGHIFVGDGSNLAVDVAMSGDATIVSGGVLTLANTGVAAGSYTVNGNPIFTVDSKGRLTAASNVVTASGGVTSVTGTTNRITASPTTGAVVVDIAATYVGQTSITTLGTVTTGTWGTGAIIARPTMTLGSDATGDTYYRNAGGILTRLGIGSSAQVLTVAAGLPSWATPTTGTVTSVSAGNLSPLFTTVVNTATTTPSIVFSQVSQSQNLFFASPSGSSGNPTFRAVVAADLGTGAASTKVLFGNMTWGTPASSTIVNTNTYHTIGYVGIIQTYSYIVSPDWSFPGEFIISIDNTWKYVGVPTSDTNLITLLNNLIRGTFTLLAGVITVNGFHDYGEIIELTGQAVSPTSVLEIDLSSPQTILDVMGFSCRRLSEDHQRATDAPFIALMTPMDMLFADPWPDPHNQWYHVDPLGGGDGPNIEEFETISRGKTLLTVQDGIGAVTYGYDWFTDYVATLVACGITETVMAVNLASLLIQLIPRYSYTFLSSTAVTDPTSGKLKINATDPSLAVTLSISETDGTAVNIATRIVNWKKVTIYKNADPTHYAIFNVTAAVDNGTWQELTLTFIAQQGAVSVGSSPFANNDPVTIISVNENSAPAINVNLINYTDTYAEWDFMMASFATAGITVKLFQFTLEMGLSLTDDMIHSPTDYFNICDKVTTDYFIPNYPAIPRAADAYAVDDTTSHFATYNAVMDTLNVDYIRQYFHFFNDEITYDLNRQRLLEFAGFLDLFETTFPGKNVVFPQAAIKAGNPMRLKVGSGLIFSELLMDVVDENLNPARATSDLIQTMTWYDLGQIINGKSTTIRAIAYFLTLVRGMFKNDGRISATFTEVDQSSALRYIAVKKGTKAEVYVINPTAFPINISAVEVSGIAKNVKVESYYGDPLDSDAQHYLVLVGATVLLNPFSLTKISTL